MAVVIFNHLTDVIPATPGPPIWIGIRSVLR
jgi:hypothetical protein